MPSKKTKSRVSPIEFSPNVLSRSISLDSPLWLVLYHLDFLICQAGFFRRRFLLSLRNDLLTALNVPSGDAWFVRVVEQGTKTKTTKD